MQKKFSARTFLPIRNSIDDFRVFVVVRNHQYHYTFKDSIEYIPYEKLAFTVPLTAAVSKVFS